jgi:hypothetical protein
VVAVLAAPDLNAVSLGEEHMTKPNNITPDISRVCAASKARVQYDDVSAGKFLKGFLFSGGPMPKLESARGKAKTTKKHAPPSGAPAGASMDAPLDLESDPPVAKKPCNIFHEASYAMDAPAGDRRVLAHNIAMRNEELAQRAAALELARALRKSAAEQERSERAAFTDFDVDGSGEIDLDEWKEFCGSIEGGGEGVFGGGESVFGSDVVKDDFEEVYGFANSLKVCVCCSRRGKTR